LPAINEDPSSNPGATVNSVFASSVAITAVDNSHGTWQYSSNGGNAWTNFGGVTAGSARLLDTTYSLRFVPNADWNGSATLTYRAWTGSGGTAGGTADASSGGGNFSANTADAAITVNAVNDAPVLAAASPTLTSLDENAVSNGGQTIASIVGATISDVD